LFTHDIFSKKVQGHSDHEDIVANYKEVCTQFGFNDINPAEVERIKFELQIREV
jgi:hypothetical protein